MQPTKEQIEHYIKAADDELGPECAEEWVEEVRKYLRDRVSSNSTKFSYGGRSISEGNYQG